MDNRSPPEPPKGPPHRTLDVSPAWRFNAQTVRGAVQSLLICGGCFLLASAACGLWPEHQPLWFFFAGMVYFWAVRK
jgi:hypothetical protein